MRIDGVKWYTGRERGLDRAVRVALEKTGAEVVRDLRDSHTLPWAEDSEENRKNGVVPGELSGATSMDRSESGKLRVAVVSNTPYARRLYFHPEYSFYQGTNEAAGARWFEPYKKGGSKKDFAQRAFSKFLGMELAR